MRNFKSTVIFLFGLVTAIGIVPKKILASDENEQYHLTIIAKDPNSEQSRLEYSRFLYSKDRLTEALNQVGYVLKLNPKNLEAA